MSTKHEQFQVRLKESVDGVFAVGKWLHIKGLAIYVPPYREAPTAAQHKEYSDDGDLYTWDIHGRERIIQVKRQKDLHFTGRHDWPFPNRFFVASKGSVDRLAEKLGKVGTYFRLGDDMKHAAVVMPHTKDDWYVETKKIKNTQNYETNYLCPIDHVIWISLDEPYDEDILGLTAP